MLVFFFTTRLCMRVLAIFFLGGSRSMREREKKERKKNPCIDNNEIRENFHCSRVATIERKTVMVQEINLDWLLFIFSCTEAWNAR